MLNLALIGRQEWGLERLNVEIVSKLRYFYGIFASLGNRVNCFRQNLTCEHARVYISLARTRRNQYDAAGRRGLYCARRRNDVTASVWRELGVPSSSRSWRRRSSTCRVCCGTPSPPDTAPSSVRLYTREGLQPSRSAERNSTAVHNWSSEHMLSNGSVHSRRTKLN